MNEHLVMQEMHDIVLSIKTAEATFSPVAVGFDNMQEQLNETVQQYKFLADHGFSRSRVTGMAPVWTLTGRRIFGDAAQDYIFSKKYALGAERETEAKVEYTPDGGSKVTIKFLCTFANIQEFAGATEENSAISVEVHVDGEPTVE